MKTIPLRLLPVSLVLLGLNSCVVAPGPAYVRTPGVSVEVGAGPAEVVDDADVEMGYWGPNGEFSVVFVPGWTRDYVYYDAYGHRDRHGRFDRHHHEAHHRGGESRSRVESSHHRESTTRSTQSSTHHAPTSGSSFKAAQQAAPAALSKKAPAPAPAPVKKKKDQH